MTDEETVELHAEQGTDEVNLGTESFPVERDGTVEVPVEAVGPLVEKGGFTVVGDDSPAPQGTVKMRCADCSSCTFGGDTYEPDANGDFTVPGAAIEALKAHGFTLAED